MPCGGVPPWGARFSRLCPATRAGAAGGPPSGRPPLAPAGGKPPAGRPGGAASRCGGRGAACGPRGGAITPCGGVPPCGAPVSRLGPDTGADRHPVAHHADRRAARACRDAPAVWSLAVEAAARPVAHAPDRPCPAAASRHAARHPHGPGRKHVRVQTHHLHPAAHPHRKAARHRQGVLAGPSRAAEDVGRSGEHAQEPSCRAAESHPAAGSRPVAHAPDRACPAAASRPAAPRPHGPGRKHVRVQAHHLHPAARPDRKAARHRLDAAAGPNHAEEAGERPVGHATEPSHPVAASRPAARAPARPCPPPACHPAAGRDRHRGRGRVRGRRRRSARGRAGRRRRGVVAVGRAGIDVGRGEDRGVTVRHSIGSPSTSSPVRRPQCADPDYRHGASPG